MENKTYKNFNKSIPSHAVMKDFVLDSQGKMC